MTGGSLLKVVSINDFIFGNFIFEVAMKVEGANQFGEGISASSTLLESNSDKEAVPDLPTISSVESFAASSSKSQDSFEASNKFETNSGTELPLRNIHQHPDWLKELKSNFHQEIIVPCSARTRQAVDADEYVEVGRCSSDF